MTLPRADYTGIAMQSLTGNEIREMFLGFFESKGHRRVHSSSLVPANDPTLLFTNAGMNQFKDLFLGAERREYSRATTSQKCVRAGGKHNDLENVGFTRRHHTFFEMLGNFSFGDYFKQDAIAFAWELVTSAEWYGIPKDRLYVTIFEGDPANGVPRDDEAEAFWIAAGVPKERIREYGLKDNFWQMGETGPCGPCSEIFYDMGLAASEHGRDLPFGEDDARYVEIWNLVFMQFDRSAVVEGGKTVAYKLSPLPKPSIDTGMGLERLAAVLQGKLSNFETDLFTPLIEKADELTEFIYRDVSAARRSASIAPPLSEESIEVIRERERLESASLRIIADHARAATFLINDGVIPSNEGRGYVLRKILRRGIRHGRLLGQAKPFMFEMVHAVKGLMRGAYPELNESAERVARVIEAEERQFERVLSQGWKELATEIALAVNEHQARAKELEGNPPNAAVAALALRPRTQSESGVRRPAEILRASGEPVRFDGRIAFKIFETFGLPKDFITEEVRDMYLDFDEAGFEAAKESEQARARASWKGGSQKTASPAYTSLSKTIFEGYTSLVSRDSEILALVKDGVGVPAAAAGETVDIVIDHTSFYADSGGQVGDTGWLTSVDSNTQVADVVGCVAPVQGVRAHKAVLKQAVAVGDRVNAVVDGIRRDAIRRNHTGTHLFHAALRQVLGAHVKQAGSSVDAGRLRFDFSHFAQVADEELSEIESIVNREVLANACVETLVDVPIDVAVNEYHAMALFGEKYGDKVRVVRVLDGFSTELCGGTHTTATGEIGLLKIVSESSVSSGVRRLEAISGLGSLEQFRQYTGVAQVAAQAAPGADLADALRTKLANHEDELKKLRRELDELRMKSAAGGLSEALAGAVDVGGVKVATLRADGLDRGQLRTLVDNLKQRLGEGVVVLGSAQPEGKVAIIAGVTPGLIKRIQAGKLVGAVAKLVGGSGGGKPEIAEAGGKDQAQLGAALAAVPGIVKELLG